MVYLTPIELITKEYDKYNRALVKSTIAYNEQHIDKETHETHRRNLQPKISEYYKAICKLTEDKL